MLSLQAEGQGQMAIDLGEENLIPQMAKLMKAIRSVIVKELKANGIDLSKEQVIVLKWLQEKDGRPQNDLAILTSRDKTSLTRLLSKMEAKHLICRIKSKSDKRIKLIYITDKGKNELGRALPIVVEVFKQATKGIAPNRLKTTKSLLKDIYNNMQFNYEEQ